MRVLVLLSVAWLASADGERRGRVLTRAPALLLRRFEHSGDERLLAWLVPPAVSEMRLNAKAHRNVSIHSKLCGEKNVSVLLKYGSYPVLNPGNFQSPKECLDAGQRAAVYSLHLETSRRNRSLVVPNPRAGVWYAAAFVDWIDPRFVPIKQSGLLAVCYTFLYAEVSVAEEHPPIVQSGMTFVVDLSQNNRTYFRYFSDAYSSAVELTFSVNCKDCTSLALSVEPNELPSVGGEAYHRCVLALAPNDANVSYAVVFPVFPEADYYAVASRTDDSSAAKPPCSIGAERTAEKNVTFSDLTKEVSADRFVYDLSLPRENGSWGDRLALSDDAAALRWRLRGTVDIGGTLTVALSLKVDVKYYTGFVREKILDGTAYRYEGGEEYLRVVVCLREGRVGEPRIDSTCGYGARSAPALVTLANLNASTVSGFAHVPYPEEGVWFLSLRAFRAARADGSPWSVPADGSPPRDGLLPGNATVLLSVSSAPCFANGCGRFGDCEYFESGGVILSGCVCRLNYGGWACDDDRSAFSSTEILLGTLLLTLSNAAFLATAYVAYRRRYFAEAATYALTAAASATYHACDAPDRAYAACLTDARALQFADFYCGLLSMWTTLLLMAALERPARGAWRLGGAVLIALLTAWNRRGIAAFALPLGAGLAVALLSRWWEMRRARCGRPSRAYLLRWLPLGAASLAVGLVCYAFLQTEENYKAVHSAWHVAAAAGLACLLPDAPTYFPPPADA